VRGIMLKGNGWAEIWPNLWPLTIFLFVVGAVALLRYRTTLDCRFFSILGLDYSSLWIGERAAPLALWRLGRERIFRDLSY
jgi:hypothetical protein